MSCNWSFYVQIFEFLHPIDLYHLLCTTKSLRRFLLDRSSLSVWETVFLRHTTIQSPPTDVSLPKWASLLFGPATCDVYIFSPLLFAVILITLLSELRLPKRPRRLHIFQTAVSNLHGGWPSSKSRLVDMSCWIRETEQKAKYKSRDKLSELVFEALGNYPGAQDDLWRLVRYTYRSSRCCFIFYMRLGQSDV
jgi:hypothetical protein